MTLTSSGHAQIWDVESNQLVQRLLIESDVCRAIAFTSNGSLLMACDNGKLHEYPIPISANESPDRIRAWLELKSTQAISGRPLSFDHWQERQNCFFKFGSMPAYAFQDETKTLPMHDHERPPVRIRAQAALSRQQDIVLSMVNYEAKYDRFPATRMLRTVAAKVFLQQYPGKKIKTLRTFWAQQELSWKTDESSGTGSPFELFVVFVFFGVT